MDSQQSSVNRPFSSAQLPIAPAPIDLDTRRCLSDSVLSHGRRCSSYRNRNTAYMMFSRSGSSTVKLLIEEINDTCEIQEQLLAGINAGRAVPPPEDECSILATWAQDSYYRIVIAAKHGIAAVIRAMRAFPLHQGLQECCCVALGNLCSSTGANLMEIENSGGVNLIIAAMKNFPRSVAVQSAACEALRNMGSLILAHASRPNSPVTCELTNLLSRACEMYMHPSHKAVAQSLLSGITLARMSTAHAA